MWAQLVHQLQVSSAATLPQTAVFVCNIQLRTVSLVSVEYLTLIARMPAHDKNAFAYDTLDLTLNFNNCFYYGRRRQGHYILPLIFLFRQH